jgi:two-component system response regulator RegX3
MKTRILVVDDDALHSKFLSFLLNEAGYEARILHDRRAVRRYLAQNAADLILLDVTLPFGSGLGFCMRLRRDYSDIPIILLSTRASTTDLVKGFSQGADDFITRPYEPAELLARVQAVLRRYRRVERNLYGVLVKVGNTALDLGRLSFTAASGHAVLVTPTEMRILECLMRNAHSVISREKLIEQTWGYDSESADNRVDVYIRRLRHKIETHPKDRNLIRTVRGTGYIYEGDLPTEQRSA